MAKVLVGTKIMDATTIPSQFFISKEDVRMLLLENPGVEIFAKLPQTTCGPLTYPDFLKLNSIGDLIFFLKSKDVKAVVTPSDIYEFDYLIESSIMVELKRIGRPVKVNQFDKRLFFSSDNCTFEIDTIFIDHEGCLVFSSIGGVDFFWEDEVSGYGTTFEKSEVLDLLIEIV